MDLGLGALISIGKYICSIPRDILAKFEADDSIKISMRYLNDKKYDLAASCFDTAIEKNKSDNELCSHLYTLKGISLRCQGFAILSEISDRISSGSAPAGLDPTRYFDNALAEFNNALKLNATNPWVWYQKGATFLIMQEFRDAIQCFENALSLDSVSDELCISLLELEGGAYSIIPGEEDKALECYMRIIELDPSNENAIFMIEFYKDPAKAREKWFG
ncbi:MAG: tetratricopeptide repeat protein [Methanothrix sp.]